jgi:hypothetical protein
MIAQRALLSRVPNSREDFFRFHENYWQLWTSLREKWEPDSLPIAQLGFAAFAGAVGAAEDSRTTLDAVSDDPAAATTTYWRHHVDCALEAVEDVGFVFEADLERLVVVVSAMFTSGHKFCSFPTFRFDLISPSLRTE